MFGRKTKAVSGPLAQRVRTIAEAPPSFADAAELMGRKRELRKPLYRPGTLTFTGGERVDVVVTNLSAMGARIAFKRGTPLPERVMLTEPRTGLKHWALVTWQTWGVAGLKFVATSQAGR